MATQIETKTSDVAERQPAEKPDAPDRFSMEQGIRREIAEMLAAKKRGFTVADYYYLAEVGILDEDDRVELIDGEIVLMSPINVSHAACVKAFTREFYMTASEQAVISVQDPIHLSDNSEPQPDVVLLRPRDDLYAASHPTPEDILLLVEVSDSTIDKDRNEKLPRYAESGVPEVWIASLPDNWVERYRNPGTDGYGEVRQFARGETISPRLLPNVQVNVNDILPQQ